MSHSVDVQYDGNGWIRLVFKQRKAKEEYCGSEFSYLELSPEDKNYLIHLLKYEPIK